MCISTYARERRRYDCVIIFVSSRYCRRYKFAVYCVRNTYTRRQIQNPSGCETHPHRALSDTNTWLIRKNIYRFINHISCVQPMHKYVYRLYSVHSLSTYRSSHLVGKGIKKCQSRVLVELREKINVDYLNSLKAALSIAPELQLPR